MFEQIAKVDKTFKDGKHSILKDRLAEAVRDDDLGRELRRLTIEVLDLTYFELRDSAVKWTGRGGKVTTIKEEVICKEKMIEDIVERVVKKLQVAPGPSPSSYIDTTKGSRCWTCNSTTHLRKSCPSRRSQQQSEQDAINTKRSVDAGQEAVAVQSVGKFSLNRAIGKRPEVIIKVDGVEHCCLANTGTEVSTMTAESFYDRHFSEKTEDVSGLIKITAANGTEIQLVGYFEPQVEILGKKLRIGFLVVSSWFMGSNAFDLLKETVGIDLGSTDGLWNSLLTLYSEETATGSEIGAVKSKDGVVISVRSVRQVEVTVPQMKRGHTISALIERHNVCVRHLPQGIVVGRSLVTIDGKGRVPV